MDIEIIKTWAESQNNKLAGWQLRHAPGSADYAIATGRRQAFLALLFVLESGILPESCEQAIEFSERDRKAASAAIWGEAAIPAEVDYEPAEGPYKAAICYSRD